MNCILPCRAWACLVLLCWANLALAQFSTVINAPPDSLETPVSSDTQVNITDPPGVGTIQFAPGAQNVEINLLDGDIGVLTTSADNNSHVVVNVAGGDFNDIITGPGVTLNYSGGNSRRGEITSRNANQVSVTGGLLGILTTSRTPTSISGGVVGRAGIADGELSITGGSIARGSVGRDGIANIAGGTLEQFQVSDAGVANITGGTFGYVRGSTTRDGPSPSNINVSGGHFERFFTDGFYYSDVNISGGYFDLVDRESTNSRATHPRFYGSLEMSGGYMRDPYYDVTASVAYVGNNFKLDGVDVRDFATEVSPDQLQMELPSPSILSGILSDGTPFAFSRFTSNNDDLMLRYEEVDVILEPLDIELRDDSLSPLPQLGLNLTLQDGGSIPDKYDLMQGSLIVNGGEPIVAIDIVDSVVEVYGGSFGFFDRDWGCEPDRKQRHLRCWRRVTSSGYSQQHYGSCGR